MDYKELLDKHSKELNEFSKDKIYFFFGTENDVQNKLNELDLSIDDLVNIGLGGYIRKEFKADYDTIIERHSAEKKAYALNNVYEVVKYYCWDYEIEISLSYTYDDVLYILCDFTADEVKQNLKEIRKAFKDYRKEFYELN